MKFSGLGTALITPFVKSKEIDFKALEKLIKFQVKNGVDFLVIGGTTGESATLTSEEIFELIKFSKKVTDIPIVVGVGSNSTKTVTDRIKEINKMGADGYLVVSPYYNKPTQEGLVKHYNEVAKAAGKIPIILYNVPGRTSSTIEPETVVEIIKNNKNVVAIKEASGDLNFAMKLYTELREVDSDFTLISGDDALTLPLISIGYNGVISVVSNEFPGLMKEMVSSAIKSDFKKANAIHYELLNIMKANFIESNPIPVKYVMKKLGFCDGSVRLPLVELNNKKQMDKVLEEYV